MHRFLAATLFIATVAGLVTLPLDGLAASKQGGGAFAPAQPAKKKTVRSKPRTTTPKKAAVAPQVNYDGVYSARFTLEVKNADLCWSGRRDLTIQNNRASLQVFPVVGDTLGGTIRGGTLHIVKTANGSLSDPFDWTGTVQMPAGRSQTGTGKLVGISAKGDNCTWRLELTRK